MQLFDKGVEMDVGVQTDLFVDRPATPVYVPAKTGADAFTQIYPGDVSSIVTLQYVFVLHQRQQDVNDKRDHRTERDVPLADGRDSGQGQAGLADIVNMSMYLDAVVMFSMKPHCL